MQPDDMFIAGTSACSAGSFLAGFNTVLRAMSPGSLRWSDDL